jgi:hypothetical protein
MLQPDDVKVTNITRGARIMPDGTRFNYYNVQFTLRGTTVDAVEIPADQYTADTAIRMVQALATEHARVLDL